MLICFSVTIIVYNSKFCYKLFSVYFFSFHLTKPEHSVRLYKIYTYSSSWGADSYTASTSALKSSRIIIAQWRFRVRMRRGNGVRTIERARGERGAIYLGHAEETGDLF